jgi:CDGSH-type Zn-finger protein
LPQSLEASQPAFQTPDAADAAGPGKCRPLLIATTSWQGEHQEVFIAMSAPTPTIDCKPDGPYLVKGLTDLRSSDGRSLAVQPVVALCRCGGSANKPFCDGTHQRNGLSGARVSTDAPGSQRSSYRGPGLTIHDDRALCAHAGRCTDGLATVFKYGSEPWIDPAGADVAAIVETVRHCPSGALSVTLDTPAPPMSADPPAEAPAVVITKNGPYAVTGAIPLADPATGQHASTPRYTLCRCGASKNKPFCDGSHWDAGFSDDKN